MILKIMISLMNSHSGCAPDPTNLAMCMTLLCKNTKLVSRLLSWTDRRHRNEAWLLHHITVKLTALYSEPLVKHLSIN